MRRWAAGAAVIAALPVAAAGLAISGPSPIARSLPLEAAFESELAVVAFLLIGLWPLVALAPSAPRGLRARELELALLVAAAAPALLLAAAFSRVEAERVRATLGWLVLLGGA